MRNDYHLTLFREPESHFHYLCLQRIHCYISHWFYMMKYCGNWWLIYNRCFRVFIRQCLLILDITSHVTINGDQLELTFGWNFGPSPCQVKYKWGNRLEVSEIGRWSRPFASGFDQNWKLLPDWPKLGKLLYL